MTGRSSVDGARMRELRIITWIVVLGKVSAEDRRDDGPRMTRFLGRVGRAVFVSVDGGRSRERTTAVAWSLGCGLWRCHSVLSTIERGTAIWARGSHISDLTQNLTRTRTRAVPLTSHTPLSAHPVSCIDTARGTVSLSFGAELKKNRLARTDRVTHRHTAHTRPDATRDRPRTMLSK